jgi:hypothetical protein
MKMTVFNNTRVLRTILLLIVVCLISLPAYAKYSGGTGQPNDPYQIATAEDLMLLGDSREDYDEHFILTAEIDLDPNLPGRKVFDKAVIAPDTSDYWPNFQGTPFIGVFDGNGYTISNLTIRGTRYLGLFGRLGSVAKISNLGLVDVDINGTGFYIGGLAGENDGGIITTCCSTGTVSGHGLVGGLVGQNEGIVTNCYSRGTVSGSSAVGGLVGRNKNLVSNCYSTVSISNYGSDIGGLVGDLYVGLAGDHGIITQSFWDTETSGQSTSGGGAGLNTEQMQTANTFLDAGWGFVGETENGIEDIWWILEGLDHPRLWWEIPTKYGGGKGGPNLPYLIYTAEHLNTVGTEPNDWDKHFRLMADIDLSGYSYDAALIAPDVDPCDLAFQGTSFAGVLDGNGHTISNLTITGESYLGLFGQLDSGSEIKNLGLTDVNITGSDYIGGFVGFSRSNITTSYCTGTISGDKRIGGLTGRNWGTITESYCTATVTGNDNVGGIAGGNYGSITNSYSTGAVTSYRDLGGIVGENYGTIATCYSTGTVSGTTRAGGLVGYNWPDTGIVSGFWDVETTGQSTSDGGTAMTTVEMQTASTFLEAGWDFVDETANGTEAIWWILEGQYYPRLWWEQVTRTKYSGGIGTSDDPYKIATFEDLMLLSESPEDYDEHFILTAEINLDPNLPGRKVFDRSVIGGGIPFTGVLDGNGHAISHLTITGSSYLGLFGQLWPGAEVKNLGVVDVKITGSGLLNLGGLVGYNRGSVTQCYSSGTIIGGDFVGGLVGDNSGAVINCYSTCSVTGTYGVGGLVGYSWDSNITDCYSTSVVTGSYSVGGLVGVNTSNMINCYSTGVVMGKEAIGGLVGMNGLQGTVPYPGYIDKSYSLASVRGEIFVGGLVGDNRIGGLMQCYSTGTVTGNEYVGGLVGQSYFGSIANNYSTGAVSGGADHVGGLVGGGWLSDTTASFWDIQTSGQTTSHAGTGKTTAEMQSASTFLDAGWDFVDETANGTEDIWWILEGRDYPRLWWEAHDN